MAEDTNSNIGLLGGLLGGFGAYQQYSGIGDIQKQYATTIGGLQETLPTQVAFKPYTITSGVGSTSTDEYGGQTFGLADPYSTLSQNLMGGAGTFYQQAMQQNPYLTGQASQFGNMLANFQGTQFNPYQLSGQYEQQVSSDLGKSGAAQITDTVSPYGFGNAGVNALSNQAMGMGSGQLGMAQFAGNQAQGLANQYAGMASQAGQGLLTSQAGREQEIYNRIRAAQTPEEQRQASELEQRLAAQGRLGVQTAQYGGTPEQLAQAKAQAEARNSAMLSAMQQAGTEQQQRLATAQGLGGMAGQFMGQASDLQSAAQNRAQQLANMGMSAAQINSQLQSEGLSRATTAGSYNRQGTMMSDQLTQSDFQRRLAAGEFGRQGQALASQLASQSLSRDLQMGGFSTQQQQLAQQMQGGNIANMLQLAGGQNQALQQALQQQAAQAQLGSGMLQGAFSPYDYMFKQSQLGADTARTSQAARETQANLLAQLGLGGLAEQTKLEQIRGDILRQAMQAAGGIGTATLGSGSSIDSALGGLLSSAGGSLLEAIFGESASTPTLGSGGPAI